MLLAIHHPVVGATVRYGQAFLSSLDRQGMNVFPARRVWLLPRKSVFVKGVEFFLGLGHGTLPEQGENFVIGMLRHQESYQTEGSSVRRQVGVWHTIATHKQRGNAWKRKLERR